MKSCDEFREICDKKITKIKQNAKGRKIYILGGGPAQAERLWKRFAGCMESLFRGSAIKVQMTRRSIWDTRYTGFCRWIRKRRI